MGDTKDMAHQQMAPPSYGQYGQQQYGQQKYGQQPIRHQPNAQQQMTAANDITSHFMVGCSKLLAGICFPCALCMGVKTVNQYQRAVILRLGRIKDGQTNGGVGPGAFFTLPCTDETHVVDMRTVTMDVPPQVVLTKDSVTISVDAVVFYRIQNATAAVMNIANAHHSTKLLAQTQVRNVLGTRSLKEILDDKETISNEILKIIDVATDPWGIKVEKVELKDIRLQAQVQRAFAAEAEAGREAAAKKISADGELEAALMLKKAAEMIDNSPAALQLRYLQTLNQISTSNNSTIVVPIPKQFLSK